MFKCVWGLEDAYPRYNVTSNGKEAPWIRWCDLSELNYAKIAEDSGCYGVRVERPGEISEALRNAFDSGKPAIVDVVTDKREYAPIGLIRRVREDTIKRFGVPPY